LARVSGASTTRRRRARSRLRSRPRPSTRPRLSTHPFGLPASAATLKDSGVATGRCGLHAHGHSRPTHSILNPPAFNQVVQGENIPKQQGSEIHPYVVVRQVLSLQPILRVRFSATRATALPRVGGRGCVIKLRAACQLSPSFAAAAQFWWPREAHSQR
jgi:hypothetical protein